jgi:cytochrome c553
LKCNSSRRPHTLSKAEQYLQKSAKEICAMKTQSQSALTQQAMRALTDAAVKVMEDHRRSAKPLAVWTPATEASALNATATPYRTKTDGRKRLHSTINEFEHQYE